MKWRRAGLVAGTLVWSLAAQSPTSFSEGSKSVWNMPKSGGLFSGYRRPHLPDAHLEDSVRLQDLFHNGQIYLSLHDALSLALENNLDLELERYGIRLADSDVLRSKSGSLPRGIPLSVRDSPAGLGSPAVGPNGTLGGGDTPALASLIGPGIQVDLSILGSVPLPTGPPVPNLDPQIVGTVNGGHSSEIQNSTFLPGVRSLNSTTTNANVAFQQGFTTGGNLQIFFNNGRLDQNNPLLLFNPSVTSNVGITFTQPLLRSFGFAANRRYIRISKNNRRVSETVFTQQLIATVSGVVRLYWDLVSLMDDVRVREEAVASAEQFLRDTSQRLETGTAAEIDKTRAQSELARRQRDVAVARSLVRQQETVLKDYLTRDHLQGELAVAPIHTTDTMPNPDPVELPSIDTLYAQAIQNRPEAAQVQLQLENARLSLAGSRNALKPEVDVVGTAQNSGQAGSSMQALDPLLTGGYGDALGQLVNNNFPSYAVGVQLALPIRNQAARSDLLRDEITVRQQQIRIRQLEKNIRLEVTNAAIAVEQARETFNATKNERIFQEQALAAEQQKLEAGASTSLFVIQYQRDLAAARSAEISALASYQKAKTALQQATGTILGDYQIQMQEAYSGTVRQKSRPVIQ